MSWTAFRQRFPGTVLVAAMLLAGATPYVAAAEEAGTGGLPAPDAAIQAILQAMTRPRAAPSTELFDRMKQLTEGRHDHVVQQLFLFSLEAKGTREAMLPGVIIEALGITGTDIASGLVPLLEVKDEDVRGKVENWLGQAERPGDDSTIDFSVYDALLKGRGENPPTALIQHMRDLDPEAARAALARAFGDDQADTILRDL